VSVERPSPLGRALAHRIRVMDGCVVWVRDIPCFQGACEEEGAQNLKRIKQILSELYFPQLRHLRQVT
jgi:hypothetical protein